MCLDRKCGLSQRRARTVSASATIRVPASELLVFARKGNANTNFQTDDNGTEDFDFFDLLLQDKTSHFFPVCVCVLCVCIFFFFLNKYIFSRSLWQQRSSSHVGACERVVPRLTYSSLGINHHHSNTCIRTVYLRTSHQSTVSHQNDSWERLDSVCPGPYTGGILVPFQLRSQQSTQKRHRSNHLKRSRKLWSLHGQTKLSQLTKMLMPNWSGAGPTPLQHKA